MSIRHDLVDLILMALDDPRSPSIAHISAMAGRRARVENGIDTILTRYAVVELPEPDSVTESMDEYQGLAEWKTDLARIGEFDDGDGFIDTELSRLMNVSPGAMRELAAALLAAANRAEAADVDR